MRLETSPATRSIDAELGADVVLRAQTQYPERF